MFVRHDRPPLLAAAAFACVLGSLGVAPGTAATASRAAWPLASRSVEPVEPVAIATGARFELVCHFEGDELAQAGLGFAERAWHQVVRALSLDEDAAGSGESERLRVHLYRTDAEYAAVDQELTGGKFARNYAFSHHESRSAHIVVQPHVAAGVLASTGLPAQTLRQIAHEAVHLTIYALVANHRWHPLWFAEGLAMWVEQRVLAAHGRSPGVESDPWTATMLHRAQRLARRQRLPNLREHVLTSSPDLDFYERYAVHFAVFEYLLSASGAHRARVPRALAAAAELRGGGAFEERLLACFERELGVSFAELDADFAHWLDARRPEWNESWRSLEVRPLGAQDGVGPWLHSAFPDDRAEIWRSGGKPFDEGRLEGRCRIVGGRDDALLRAEILIGRPGRAVVVQLGNRAVRVVRRRRDRTSEPVLARVEWPAAAALRDAGGVRFVVRCENGRLIVALGDPADPLTVDVALPHGVRPTDWGLGVGQGATVRWHRVHVVPDPPPDEDGDSAPARGGGQRGDRPDRSFFVDSGRRSGGHGHCRGVPSCPRRPRPTPCRSTTEPALGTSS